MAFQRAILPAVLSWADKLVMIGKYWNTYLIACQYYIYYIAYTGAPYIISVCPFSTSVGVNSSLLSVIVPADLGYIPMK